jgi:cytochrome c
MGTKIQNSLTGNIKVIAFSLMTLSLLSSSLVLADGAALADKGGCLACHNVDTRKVGPAFKDISAKYKGEDVQEALINKIKLGGRGAWGVLPMPPNAGKLSDEEFKQVVQWITSM